MAKLRVRARAVDMLGRQQIAGIPTAIHELFKNAHDAYASRVEVDYFREEDIFLLRDDGHGMTREDFESKWLTIGTESKVGANSIATANPVAAGGPVRPIMGEKGIGRLAIATIGSQVLVISRASKNGVLHPPVVSLIHWGLFEVPGLDLDQIEVPVVELEMGTYPDSSVVIDLARALRSNIDSLDIPMDYRQRIYEDLEALDFDPSDFVRGLESLQLNETGHGTHFIICPVSPILADDIDAGLEDVASPLQKMLLGFSNTMMPGRPEPVIRAEFRDHREGTADELIAGNAFFTPDEFEEADHHIEGSFDQYGQFDGTVSVYRRSAVAHLVPWTKNGGRKTECGPFKIKFAYLQGLVNETHLPPSDWARISGKLNRIGGLYVYRDGIRILPYGNSDYDFLNIERRRTKSAQDWFFSYRRIFGGVEISNIDNSNLVEKAGREGFRTNRAYRQFVAILENFFERLAFDFFRPTAVHGHEFNSIKERLKTEAALLAKRERRTRERRREFGAKLDKFFEDIERNMPMVESERILEALHGRILLALKNADTGRLSQSLLDAELQARSELRKLIARFKIDRPPGIGMLKTQERDWIAYLKNHEKLHIGVFHLIEEQIDQLVSEASASRSGALNRRRRIVASLELRKSNATSVASRLRRQVRKQVSELAQQVNESIRTSIARLNHDISQTFVEFGRTDAESTTERELSQLQQQWEERVDKTTAATRDLLGGLRDQLINLVDAVREEETLDATTAALESESASLKEQLNSYVDLAQVGMALGIVQHEFGATVRDIRNAIRQLRPWAAGTPELRDLEQNLKSGFDHLDSYLNLFTPLSRRLTRDKIELSGEAIRKYLDEVFGDRLRRHRVSMRFTSAFDSKMVTGFASTLLPAFVNLVDNAIYWIQMAKGNERWIYLDADEEGFLVSNSGPGIELRLADRIFEFGVTTKPGGRGMGLYLSREALRKDGFDLRLEVHGVDLQPVFRVAFAPADEAGEQEDL